MVIFTDEFKLKTGDKIVIDDEVCILCEENPIENYHGRRFKPWAAETPLGDFYPVSEILNACFN